MENGNTSAAPRRFDTFVMTGDMIIKTTSGKPSAKSTVPVIKPTASNPEGEDSSVVSGMSPEQSTRSAVVASRRLESASKHGALNGGVTDGVKIMQGKDTISQPLTSDFGITNYGQYPDSRVELDIPPDDISSDDERFRTDCSELDFDDLPPPPEEFLSEFVGAPEMVVEDYPGAGFAERSQPVDSSGHTATVFQVGIRGRIHKVSVN
jgi:hypothetical protein